jgi:hypothetical protein
MNVSLLRGTPDQRTELLVVSEARIGILNKTARGKSREKLRKFHCGANAAKRLLILR